jgi:hypothetical protein
MHKCPHCQQDGVSHLQKILSIFFGPAICSACHKPSYVHILYAMLALGTWIILTWVFIGLSYMAHTSFFLLGTIPAMVLAINKFLIQAPLICTSPK